MWGVGNDEGLEGEGRRVERGKNWENCNSIINKKYFKKLKMDLPLDPAIPLLGIHPKEPKMLIQKNISTPMFIAELFTTAKIWKQPKCPSLDEWIKQLWDIYTMEFYLAIKKKKFLLFVTAWMPEEHPK